MTHYRRGRDAEWKVRDLLRDEGFQVLRTAGSKGALDLIAVRPCQLLFVQVKLAGQQVAPTAWNRLYDLAGDAGAVPVLAEVVPRKPIRWQRLAGRKEKPGARAPFAPFALDMKPIPGEL